MISHPPARHPSIPREMAIYPCNPSESTLVTVPLDAVDPPPVALDALGPAVVLLPVVELFPEGDPPSVISVQFTKHSPTDEGSFE
jgi:hypothetical protein